MADEKKSVFEVLNGVNVNEKTERKGNLTYLSWSWAYGEVKKRYPDMNYTVYERETQYGPVCYFTDGKTCWTKVGVTINGQEHIEMLPVMDFSNKSIPLERVTSMDVLKSIQRCMTKAIARHGLGLYIYAGEDLPEDEADAIRKNKETQAEDLKEIDKTINSTRKKPAATFETVSTVPGW